MTQFPRQSCRLAGSIHYPSRFRNSGLIVHLYNDSVLISAGQIDLLYLGGSPHLATFFLREFQQVLIKV
jgi:hypothetical protein